MSNKKNITNPTTNSSTLKIEKFFGVILFLISFIFYWNAIPNETALDDVMVLTNNQFVLQGIDGIPDILKHESFFFISSNVFSVRFNGFSKMLFPNNLCTAMVPYNGVARDTALRKACNIQLTFS